MIDDSGNLAAAVTETTTKTAAVISVGAETTHQLSESIYGVLSNVSMAVAILAGVVAIICAVMNYRINRNRERREKAEHFARMSYYNKKAPWQLTAQEAFPREHD